MDLAEAEARFGASGARDGWNTAPAAAGGDAGGDAGGEPYFFVSNPAVGLWKRADT
jgi:hypothetical protein